MTEFQGVQPAFSQALTKRGYSDLTPVQKAVLDPDLHGSDLLVSAQTGSGKTVAFGLSIAPTLIGDAESFEKAPAPMALVIAPTRELALQVARELEWLYEISGAKVISCVGGMDVRSEQKALKRGPHIVVGTPGRLCDHIKRGFFDTSELKAVVLDEADEMLDMGFRDELKYILDTAPDERRTLLFSATIPKAITSMAKQYQNNAKRITTKEEAKQHLDIEYQALTIAPSDRENAIINLLRYHEARNAIIFCSTRLAVNHLTSRLTNRGFSVVALSGELSQSERSHALQALRDGRAQVCVATDVASRGIDLPGLGLVIHADIPRDRDTLLHRSGRTGRAGSKGISALVVPHNWRSRAERLLQNAKVTAKWDKPPSIKDILDRDRERFLANPAFSEAATDEEKPAVDELLTRYTPEQIAVALMRMHNTQKPAPEELLDTVPASDHKRSSRDDFKDSIWISLSAGHDVSAEARWILPMLCGAGNITKRDVGAIRITKAETYVELTAKCADKFFKSVGDEGKMEKNIIVTRMENAPDLPDDDNSDRPRRPRRNSGKKPHRGSGGSSDRSGGGRSRNGGGHKKKYDDRKSRGGKSRSEKTRDGKPSDGKSRDNRSGDGKSSGGKKPKMTFNSKGKSNSRDKPKSGNSKDGSQAMRRPKN